MSETVGTLGASPNRMRWSAILAGVVVALIVQLMLSLLGLGLGLTSIDPSTADASTARWGTAAAGVWWIIAGVVAAAAGGYVAGRSSGGTQTTVGLLHGLTAWAATMLVVLYLLTTTIGALVGGAFATVANTFGGVGRGAATVATATAPAAAMTPDPMAKIEDAVRSAAGGEDPAALRDRAVSAVRDAMSGDPARQEQAKASAADALARAQNIPQEQARQQVDRYHAQYSQALDQAKEMARRAAETSRQAGAAGSLIAFFAMVLGAAAAAVSGAAGVKALRGW